MVTFGDSRPQLPRPQDRVCYLDWSVLDPPNLDSEFVIEIVAILNVLSSPEVDQRCRAAKVENSTPVRRFGCLPKQQQALQEARLPGRIRPEQRGDRRKSNVPRVPPTFEVLQPEPS